MNTSRNRGFTMAELMVVVVVIGLLLAIAMPFFQRTFSVQRKITCINNLEKLGQAYHTRDARGALQGVDSAFPVMLWPQMLSTYLSGSIEAFICPEDQKKYSAAQSAKEQLKGSLLLGLESMSNRMTRLARSEIYYGRFISVDELVSMIEEVNTENTRRAAELALDRERLSLVALGPSSRTEIGERL